MDERRLIDIEIKLAHQEDALEQVNRVLTDQQTRLSRLEQVCRALAERLQGLTQSVPEDPGGQDKPPHY